MIAIESILHIVYSKNTGIYSGFCMCHILKDEDEDIYVIHPLLQVGPGRGGDHIYLYIYISQFVLGLYIYIYVYQPSAGFLNHQPYFLPVKCSALFHWSLKESNLEPQNHRLGG